MREIYADNAATTKLSPEVLERMLPYFSEVFGNPSSLYRIGGKAKKALDGLPPVKVHCSVLAEEAIKAAVSDYYKKRGIDPEIMIKN